MGDRGWADWMASPTQRTWVSANCRRWWRTGRPGMLQSVGSQTLRHDSSWTTTVVIQFLVFLRSLHTVFYSGCISLHSRRQCTRVPSSLHPCLQLLFVDFFLMMAILTVVRRYLVVFLCISLMINKVELLFMCLLVIHVSSLETCLFGSSFHFFIAVESVGCSVVSNSLQHYGV